MHSLVPCVHTARQNCVIHFMIISVLAKPSVFPHGYIVADLGGVHRVPWIKSVSLVLMTFALGGA